MRHLNVNHPHKLKWDIINTINLEKECSEPASGSCRLTEVVERYSGYVH
jgi:hypothetical protein